MPPSTPGTPPSPSPPDAGAPDWVDAGALADFAPGAARPVAIGDARVAVFRAAGDTLYALADRCPHAGAPLSAGALRDGVVVCTWHGWRFDAATGRCASVDWADPVPTHAVRLVDGRVQVAARPSAPA